MRAEGGEALTGDGGVKDGSAAPARMRELEAALAAAQASIRAFRRREALHEAQRRVLERIADGAPLTELFVALIDVMESQLPGMRGSVLLVNADGCTLRPAAAPRMPAEFVERLEGFPIGPAAGSCGTACHGGETVICSDTETDPLWRDHRDVARRFALRACWSKPILNEVGSVLGSFALYCSEPRSPDEDELELIDTAARLAAVAIDRARTQSALRQSEQRLRASFEQSAVGIIEASIDGRFLRVNRKFCDIVGYDEQELTGRSFRDITHPDDLPRSVAIKGSLLNGDCAETAGEEKRYLRRDGSVVWVNIWRSVVRDGDGRPQYFVASVEDITARKLTQEALRRQSEILQSTLENMNQGISVVDAEMRLIAHNHRFMELLGFPPSLARDGVAFEEFIRYNAERGEYGPGEVEQQVRERVQLARQFKHHRFERIRPNGRVLEIDGTPLPNGGFVTIYTDITERKQAQQALRRQTEILESTLENMTHGISVVDGDLRLVAFNRRFVDLLEFPPTLVRKGMAFEELARFNAQRGEYGPGDVEQLVRERVELARQFKPHRFERVRPNGRVIEVQGSPMPNGGFVTSYTDVTERTRMEKAMRDINAELEQRVRERTAALETSNKELESFSYSVSHDLRAPLRALDGFSHLLEDEYGDQLDEKGRQYLMRIRRASQRMGILIDDLIDLARISRREMACSSVNLTEMAHAVARDLWEHSPPRTCDWRIEPALITEADPVLVQVMLENLLRNAWKFTSQRNEARIEFGATEQNGETVFFVRDNGAGFDMAYVGKLFAPFQRLHSPSQFEGSGIGLAIVERVIRRHGGRVWAEGAPGRGATFYFTLRARARAAGAAQ